VNTKLSTYVTHLMTKLMAITHVVPVSYETIFIPLLFCSCYIILRTNTHHCCCIKDAYITSIDRKGFDVLAKVTSPALKNGTSDHQWKEFRFMFKDDANDVEMFFNQLVEMEEEVINKVSISSGLK